jgi:hypothetical protein
VSPVLTIVVPGLSASRSPGTLVAFTLQLATTRARVAAAASAGRRP